MNKPITKKAWLEYIEKTWDAAQEEERPWVGLTDVEIAAIVGPYGDTPITGYTRQLFDKIEAKLKEKNFD